MSTLVYPQLGTGALSQFPVRKTRRMRTVVNASQDGGSMRLADPAAETTEWRLEYAALSDEEAAAVEAFFAAAEGTLNGFTFVDPAGNLLAWSGKLDDAVWQKDPLLAVTSGIDDPAGGTLGWRANNPGGGPQMLAQTLDAPGGYTYCFSVYLRAAAPATVELSIGSATAERVVTSGWGRVTFAATPAATAAAVRFGIAVAAGAAVDVYGPQVEAQGGASAYRETSRGGVYADAHLGDDVLSVTRTDFNRNSCTVNIIHANHL
jgi:hypothetical protein